MTDSHTYTVDLRWNHDRQGTLDSPELVEALKVATPPPFANGVEGIWSPEHLFTAAVSSCLMTTFLAIAGNSKLPFESFDCRASGKLEQVDGKYRMTEVLLEPRLIIPAEEWLPKAERILQKAEAACLITNSINAKVIMRPEISVHQPAEG
ncbi:MAG: OsmC family protein [Cyclobacteriaceae bacterium]|jgi:organic hydroperoxide reductase OsmC/OhrA|nr:OsmC family protein [Cyclobacteriaceae bacterium]